MKSCFGVIIAMAGFAGALLTGCSTPPSGPSPYAPGSDRATRNNSYSLLYQLLEEQKEVSLLHFIKREDPDLKDLIGRIAKASGEGAKTLEEMAKRDPSIVLHDVWLPPGEVKTRAAISSTKESTLLSKKGGDFELALLLTQTEALNYAWHLARVADEYEPRSDNARILDGLSKEMHDLYDQVFAMLLKKTESSPSAQ